MSGFSCGCCVYKTKKNTTTFVAVFLWWRCGRTMNGCELTHSAL